MRPWCSHSVPLTTLLCLAVVSLARGEQTEMGNGFRHHGVATPVSNHRGIVCTADGQGRGVVLAWLFDHRGGYALLVIDAETGTSQELAMPFAPGGDCPYASILSSRNKYYTHFNSHFVEFDPQQGKFTFCHETAPQMAMSMTEDDQGVIWSVTYPNSGLVSYNPATGEFQDYGHLHKENWLQYPRYIAADDQGWIYFAIGNTLSHILVFDPVSRQVREAVPSDERAQGEATVYRDLDGTVYGHQPGDGSKWYRFHGGKTEKIAEPVAIRRKPIIADTQGLFHRNLPNGDTVVDCDLVERKLVVESAGSGVRRELAFDYTSEGAHIMGLATAPDNTICGGTAFPMRFFCYDPQNDSWINRASYSQWNTVARQGDHFFVGGYPTGFLLDWDPAKEWVPTEIDNTASNPRHLIQCTPDIIRPHALLAHPDGKTLILGGTPAYGRTGGGLLLWDRDTSQHTLLTHHDLLAEHSTTALVALPSGKVLGGTTTAAGTGGERKASQAELYVLDLASKKIEWHDYDAWSLAAKIILVLLMIIGGCTGSTGGGIKVGRVLIALKYTYNELIRSLHPKAVMAVKIGDKTVKENTVKSVLLFIQLYILIFIFATLAFAIFESANPQFNALSAISAAACCLGVVGPGFGVVALDFTGISQSGRVLGVFCMYIGRLEILPVILMFLPETWKK